MRRTFLSFFLAATAPLAMAQSPAVAGILGGDISGNVWNTFGEGIPGIRVQVFQGATEVDDSCTGENGDYQTPALEAGTYSITFSDDGVCADGLQAYATDQATDVVVATTSVVRDITLGGAGGNPVVTGFALISTPAPLEGIRVDYWDAGTPEGSALGGTCTNSYGQYAFALPANEDIKVQFIDDGSLCPNAPSPEEYQTEWFSTSGFQALTHQEAETVSTGTTGRAGVNLVMAPCPEGGCASPTGSIAGVITDVAEQGIENIRVDAYDDASVLVAGACTGSDGSYTIPDLPNGSYRLKVQDSAEACPGAPEVYGFVWYVVAADFETAAPVVVNGGEETASTMLVVVEGECPPETPCADLELTKTADLETAEPGDPITWTLTLTNLGPDAATNVSIRDFYGAEPDEPLPDGCSIPELESSMQCTVASLSPEDPPVTFTYTTTAGGFDQSNDASIEFADQLDPVSENDAATDTVTVACPPEACTDLSIEKTSDVPVTEPPTSIVPGTAVTYTLTVTNNGTIPATNVQVVDYFSKEPDPVSIEEGCQIPQDDFALSCTVASLGAGQSKAWSYEIAAGGAPLSNDASVSADQPDPNGENDFDFVFIDVQCTEGQCTDLGINKSGPFQAEAGDTLTYTLSVTNNGPSEATNVTLTDAAPAPLTFDAGASDPSCADAGGVVECSRGTPLPAFDENDPAASAWEVTLVYDLGATDEEVLTNTATVSSDQLETEGINDESSWDTFIEPPCDPEFDFCEDTGLVVFKSDTSFDGENEVGDPVSQGGTVEYTINAFNGSEETTYENVTVTDTLPAELTGLTENDERCAIAGGTLTCTVGTIEPEGGIEPIVVSGTAPMADAVIVNTVEIDSTTPDPWPFDNIDREATTIGAPAVAHLALYKWGPQYAVPGEPFTYELDVDNYGDATATGVTVTDELPAGLTFTSEGSDPACTADGQLVTCVVGSLESEAEASFNVAVTPSGEPGDAFWNVATIASMAPADPFLDDNSSFPTRTELVAAGTADLEIVKYQQDPAGVGLPFTYGIDVYNYGPATAESVVITDALPAGLTFLSTEPEGDAEVSCDQADGTVTCTVAQLDAGEWVHVDLEVQAEAPTPEEAPLVNSASVTHDGPDPVGGNNTAQAETPVYPEGTADLSVYKEGPRFAAAGSPMEWEIWVENAGPFAASNVMVSDALPPDVTDASAEISAWSEELTPGGCALDAGVFTCGIGGMPVNAWVVVTVRATPTTAWQVGEEDVFIVNEAGATHDGLDPNTSCEEEGCSASSLLVPPGSADVQISKWANNGAANAPLTWNIEVWNEGPAEATGVVVTDDLPDGLTYDDQASSPACDEVEGVITCAIGNLPVIDWDNEEDDNSVDLHIVATPAIEQEGLVNTASVSTISNDPDEENNSSTGSTDVLPEGSTDVSVDKFADEFGTAGTTFAYTFEVVNHGPSPATGVTVTDELPEGMTFNEGASDPACDLTIEGAIECVLDGTLPVWSGEPADLTGIWRFDIVVDVDASLDGAFVANEATVTHDAADLDNDNDTSWWEVEFNGAGGEGLLSIDKWTPSAVAAVGEEIDYWLTVENNGNAPLTDVVVTDQLDPMAVYQSSQTETSQGTCALVEGVVECELGTMSAGGFAWIHIVVLPAEEAEGVTLLNTAFAASGEQEAESDQTSTLIVAGGSADLELTKTDVQDPVVVGEDLKYVLKVVNRGPGTAEDVVLTDTLPPGTTGSIYSVNECLSNEGVVTCPLGDMPAWTQKTVTITVNTPVVPPAEPLHNTASVSHGDGTTDPVPENDEASQDTAVSPRVTENSSATGGQVSGDPGDWTITQWRGDLDPVTISTQVQCPGGGTIGAVKLILRKLTGDSVFTMAGPDGSGNYAATIPANQVGSGQLIVSVECDETPIENDIGQVVLYDPSGFVTEAGTGEPIVQAVVTLHRVPGWTPWISGPKPDNSCETMATRGAGWDQPAPTSGFVQATNPTQMEPDDNPQLTDSEGHYGWDVATGCWFVTVTKFGYLPVTSPVVGVPPEVTDLDIEMTPVSYLPDGMIKYGTKPYRGDGSYDATVGSDQTYSVKVKRGTSKTFTMKFENDGNTTDTYTITGGRSGNKFTVSYRTIVGNQAITGAVTGGGYQVELAPDGVLELKLIVKVGKKAKVGSSRTTKVTVTGSNESKDQIAGKLIAKR